MPVVKRILITGATGNIGGEVISQMPSKGLRFARLCVIPTPSDCLRKAALRHYKGKYQKWRNQACEDGEQKLRNRSHHACQMPSVWQKTAAGFSG